MQLEILPFFSFFFFFYPTNFLHTFSGINIERRHQMLLNFRNQTNVVKSETANNIDTILTKKFWVHSEDGNFFKKSEKMHNPGFIKGHLKKVPPMYCPIFVNNRQTVTKLLGHDNGLSLTKNVKKKFKKCIMAAIG